MLKPVVYLFNKTRQTMKTTTEIMNNKMKNIVEKANKYVISRRNKLEFWQIMEHKTMVKYRKEFEVESEKIGYAYYFTDCLC